MDTKHDDSVNINDNLEIAEQQSVIFFAVVSHQKERRNKKRWWEKEMEYMGCSSDDDVTRTYMYEKITSQRQVSQTRPSFQKNEAPRMPPNPS